EQMQNELSSKFGIGVHYFEKDLSKPDSAKELFYDVKSAELTVTHLINNAGFGGYGNFIETSLEHELDMINLNVNSLVV
ncbi:SDR family NAD(P)-dependent oxidoreductase, partial [Parvimonas sp. D9]|uniref:SDR family NAD(P)-dependent oxidoreductase n=1 Tax=Parvimonas sp. D9 TaxID=3110689 RepID=UPI002B49F633